MTSQEWIETTNCYATITILLHYWFLIWSNHGIETTLSMDCLVAHIVLDPWIKYWIMHFDWPGIPLHFDIDRDVSSRDKSKQIIKKGAYHIYLVDGKAVEVRYTSECLLRIRVKLIQSCQFCKLYLTSHAKRNANQKEKERCVNTII